MKRAEVDRQAGVTIRTATEDDLDALRDVYRRSSLSNPGDRAALLGAPDVLVWEGAGLAGGHTRVAVDEGGHVLGFATLVPLDDGRELEDLFVDPEHMRQGIATRLVEVVSRESAGEGAGWIEVTANPHAAAFYASAGFVAVGRVETRFGDAPRLRRATDGVCKAGVAPKVAP